MFDPNEHKIECEAYMSRTLGCQVKFLAARKLTKSTREAPWRIDIRADGNLLSYVLQVDPKNLEQEYRVLKAMEAIPVPTPRVYGLDLQGKALDITCYFSEFIDGGSLLGPMLAGEPWAEDLYIESVCSLQAVTEDQLGITTQSLPQETAEDVLDEAYDYLKKWAIPLADTAYRELKSRMPSLPPMRFSNGDLWLDNFIIRDKKLVGVIDFPNAMFSDPIFEFLLSFFASPKLQGRGIEERYCRRAGYDPTMLHWYHGLEYFDTLRWVMVTGESFEHHTEESLMLDLKKWLDDGV